MNNIKIKHESSAFMHYFILASSIFYAIIGFYISIKQALGNAYGFIFYIGLIMIIIATVLILSVTLWKAKPLVEIDAMNIIVNLSGQKSVPTIEWFAVRELGIGISNVKISTDKKIYDVELSSLKYSDIKSIKTYLMELCESKGIPYHNI